MKIILLMNLGSPKTASPDDVGAYLNEFLMDKRVIDLPFILRWILVKLVIVPGRKLESSTLYKKIWLENSFPLIEITRELANKVSKFSKKPTYFAMRYGTHDLDDVFKKIKANHKDIESIQCFPLYPHYTQSSYETAVVSLAEHCDRHDLFEKVSVFKPYYSDSKYIECLANSIKNSEDLTKYDHVLFTYHGIPLRHLKKADTTNTCVKNDCFCPIGQSDKPRTIKRDSSLYFSKGFENEIDPFNCPSNSDNKVCYKNQLEITSINTAKKLKLKNYSVSYQSRLGKSPWLTPSTKNVLSNLGKHGVKKLCVVAPGFSADCLETIVELGEEGREQFMENGGLEYTVVPCLNANDEWGQLISDWAHDEKGFYSLDSKDIDSNSLIGKF
ncbi:ferrochelatase [bacterium]|jgi:protoporphyrin/coproporphyrin ferrochelatase|nr:ferrochelatase [bacterium]